MELYGTGRVAREVRLGRARLLALLERGAIPDASHRLEGRRVFSEADLEKVRLALAERARPRSAGTRTNHLSGGPDDC
jgi:hypothetical protein